jgi:predicted acylesterase/phospholipase RssA
MSRRVGLAALLLCVVAASGCAHYPPNTQLTTPSGKSGYRFPQMVAERPDPADELFVCLSFSGGGTRAAAFAHGALLRLREIDIGRGGAPRSLLDEVDCIAGISGGAFTAAYYGLFGKAGLDTFYDRFLKRNIHVELALRVANPVNLVRLASPYFSRIDLAAELYDETVFEGRTFASLPPRPFVILHATSMANGAPFEFTQAEFDFIGSDLGTFPVARAVAASSAFPFLLSPVSLRSFPPPAGYTVPDDVTDGLEERELNPGRYYWARQHLDLMNPRPKGPDDAAAEKWVHLLDGGLADNIGLRSILRAYDRTSGFVRPRISAGHVKRFVVIAINGRTDPPEQLSRRERSPGLVDVFLKTATVSMETVSFDTIEQALRRQTEREQAQTDIRKCNEALARCGASPMPELAQEIRTCFVHIDFEGLPSPMREELLSYPTTFSLKPEQLKRLGEAARTLLDTSEGFQRLLRALRGEPRMGEGIGGPKENCS